MVRGLMKRQMIVCMALCALIGSVSAEVYKWTDDAGNVHYGDKPPAQKKANKVDVQITSYEHVEIEDFEVFKAPVAAPKKKSKRVTMYSTSWCRYCKKARAFFEANKIAYDDYDIEKSITAKRKFDALGGTGVPVILMGDKRMNGFNEVSFIRMYGFNN